ncbi:YbaN family protein [Bartonella raoultii]|uniref:YbaN family protein n=1 Tax=Bartonella raoultii TaxID=1457020 RepID=A0ABS7I3S6_9HYPH|nr:YbaN family protein [Bartonella raoultii]MBX4335354.1 YbaN family protein [Bartonella raoultii]
MQKDFKTYYPLRVFTSIVGWVMIILAIIGIVLPIMPTVPFLLVASWCFTRSSPRFHRWLHNHRVFGPPIKQWEEKRAISTFVKVFAVMSMAGGFLSFWVMLHPTLWLSLSVMMILLLIALYIVTRPSA